MAGLMPRRCTTCEMGLVCIARGTYITNRLDHKHPVYFFFKCTRCGRLVLSLCDEQPLWDAPVASTCPFLPMHEQPGMECVECDPPEL